jgi:hypothetical protein
MATAAIAADPANPIPKMPRRSAFKRTTRKLPAQTQTRTNYVADHKRKLAPVSGFYGEGDEPFIACDKLL